MSWFEAPSCVCVLVKFDSRFEAFQELIKGTPPRDDVVDLVVEYVRCERTFLEVGLDDVHQLARRAMARVALGAELGVDFGPCVGDELA
jgi:hypothetical protein